MMAREIFKDIEGTDGKYQISNLGRVYNTKHKRFLKGGVSPTGYMRVVLTIEGKRVYKNIHRLVAEAFIPNPDNLPFVNHINEEKLDNSLQNLEWCTQEHNNTWGSKASRILQYDKQGNFIAEYQSRVYAAKAVGTSADAITQCCCGNNRTAAGYIWKYKEEKSA